MARPLQHSRPSAIAAATELVAHVVASGLRLAILLVISFSLVGTASASSAKGEREGERGEFGEHGEPSHEVLSEPSRDTESAEDGALQACHARRSRANSGDRSRALGGFFVPRVISPKTGPPLIGRRLRRTSATDDDPDPDAI